MQDIYSVRLTIVTGASQNHFECLKNLLFSLYIYERKTRIIIYDLGLEPAAAGELRAVGYEVRRFAFEAYPPYVNIGVKQGQYAWKPIIFSDVLDEVRSPVVWLDAGNLVWCQLLQLRAEMLRIGIYSPVSKGVVAELTHPGTLEFLQAAPNFLVRRNRNGAVVAMRPDAPGVRELAARWKECALEERCIAPPGSNKKNHRQDQSVLTILMYQWQDRFQQRLRDDDIGFTIHNDRCSRRELRRQLGWRGVLASFRFPLG